jgi:hypothetical protein
VPFPSQFLHFCFLSSVFFCMLESSVTLASCFACGPTVGRAFHDLYYLERACMNQVMALTTNQPLREVPEEMAFHGEQQYDSQRGEAELHFASLKRVLAAEISAFAIAPIGIAAAAE